MAQEKKIKLGDYLVSTGLITEQELKKALAQQKEKGGYLGQILVDMGLVSSSDVSGAIQQLSTKVKEKDRLGPMLVKDGLITQEQLTQATELQGQTGKELDDSLLELGLIDAERLAEAFGKYLNVAYINLAEYKIESEMTKILPERLVRRYGVIPVKLEKKVLSLAMSDPTDMMAIDEIKLISNYQITPAIASKKEIARAIDQYFGIQQAVRQTLIDMRLEEKTTAKTKKEAPTTEVEAVAAAVEETPVIRLVDTILTGGVNAKASDIHMEPQEPEMRVRYRIDGILRDIMTIPRAVESSVISRVKVLADMDIAEHRKPQDGHISIKLDKKGYDLRVSSISTVAGEKIVMRILDRSAALFKLEKLGFSQDNLKTFKSLSEMPFGIILVTGPTGSGKTTTLYALLNQMDTIADNIMTVEDPVEYRLPGINQAQINPLAGVTFASALRSMMRQDPDTIMVGEIRDFETSEMAIHSALTGHLVFSTLHTNDASSALTRLIDMGVEPFLVSSSVIGVLAQRLVRTICKDCKQVYEPSEEEIKTLGIEPKGEKLTFAKGKGCSYCHQSGFRGRVGVYELLKVTDEVRGLVLKREASSTIKKVAMEQGMKTLRQSGIRKIIEGVSTPDEVNRVVSLEEI